MRPRQNFSELPNRQVAVPSPATCGSRHKPCGAMQSCWFMWESWPHFSKVISSRCFYSQPPSHDRADRSSSSATSSGSFPSASNSIWDRPRLSSLVELARETMVCWESERPNDMYVLYDLWALRTCLGNWPKQPKHLSGQDHTAHLHQEKHLWSVTVRHLRITV